MSRPNPSPPPRAPPQDPSSMPEPISPSATQNTSRNPTPSLQESQKTSTHDPSRDSSPPRSLSPPRSHSPSSQPSRMGSRPGRINSSPFHEDEAHSSIPQRPLLPVSSSAPAGRLPRLIPHDTSQYLDPTVPTAALTTSTTSLAELAHLIRLQGYQEQRRCQSRVRLHRWLVSSALSVRFVRCSELAYRTLVDNFRSDDKQTFGNLYNALHDVRNSCDATRRYALLEPDLEHGKAKLSRAENSQTFSTFMHELPSQTRDVLLQFISEVRTNPDFLATRISGLSQVELTSLTAFRQVLDPIESVMALQGRKTTTSSQKSAPISNPVERLLSFHRHDPLSALLYTIFANSSGPDSAEDLRRTDVWATTCARLITEGKQGSLKFIGSILDAWAGMREWPGKANLELYLMEVLRDGQFLLDKVDDSSIRSRTQPETRSAKDTIAADEFYDRSVKRLFEVIDDDPSAGLIPEGALEIGIAILKKLEDSKKHTTVARFFIVSRWFFTYFLMNAIIHPESQGIMSGYHISEHARQKILKEIAVRAQKPVLDMTYNWKQAIPIQPKIRTHIENILGRFKPGRSNAKPVLLRAKAITSPRETVEVQPFLVICPADIKTLVNALFPESRPSSSQQNGDISRHRGLASAASSISGMSIPFRANSTPGDASSVLSMSASSMTSDTTSREPLLEMNGDVQGGPKITPTEEYGRRLKVACSEMTRILGLDGTSGSCHPCAERWAVLYVSPDGKELRTRMRKDADDEDDTEEDSPDSDSEDETANDRIDLESDYTPLKEAISKLVEDYEIPKELAPESESKSFSNRATGIHRGAKPRGLMRADTAPVVEKSVSRNPYHSSASSGQLSNMVREKSTVPGRHRSPQNPWTSSPELKDPSQDNKGTVLMTMLEAAVNQCQARSDYVNAHLYFKTLQQLRRLSSSTLTKNGYAPLLHYFSRGPRETLGRAASAIEEFEAWFVWLKQSQERQDTTIDELMASLKSLRDKMWYITDVRNSAVYEEARNVAHALKAMTLPAPNTDGRPTSQQRSRHFSRASVSNNFLLRTEAQVLDLMAASPDYCGHNKLADEQSDLTMKWLTQFNIENFCKGEERIHRFCLEVDKCVNQLVGDGILDGPVLWSSELYRRDKESLDSGRQKGDLFLTGVGTLSVAEDEEYETSPDRPGSRSLDFAPRPSHGSLRSMANRNGSQHSFDSGKWSTGRAMDLMDSQDVFGGTSPMLSIDSSNTFWSPFQAQAAQPPSSATSVRPRTASSTKGTVMLKNTATVNEDKRRFLLDLKQTLVGLLLSDLGTIVFGGGSETDEWFSGELGEECIQRKENEDRRRKRALARKKSLRSMKSGKIEQRNAGPLDTLGRTERSQPAAPVATLQHAAPETHSAGEYSTSSSDTTARSTLSARRAGLLEFPYNLAFRRLLKRFATHPNPYSKLHALYELEQLIVASLTSRTGKAYAHRRDTLPTVPQSPTLGAVPELSSRETSVPVPRAQNLEEAIANCEERRSHSMTSPAVPNGNPAPSPLRKDHNLGGGTRSPSQPGPPSTDMIVDVLQGLFRDAEIRPRTLFRDLQYIASLVPAQLLDRTPRGKAFWDAALAALVLKQDVCRIMVEIADDIVALNTRKRAQGVQQHSSNGQSSPAPAGAEPLTSDNSTPMPSAPPPPPAEDEPLARFSMSDAARMLIITAKEGDAVAERELAIFYLTHPELLPRTILPLTKPKDVFKGDLLRDMGRNGRRGADDPARSDPVTMCVAQHWMEISKKGGDQLATKYLRARDEIESIP